MFTALGCQKESKEFEFVSKVPEPTAKYSKEVIVKDSSQKSTVLLLVSSNDKEFLDQFLEINDFVLETIEKDKESEFDYELKNSSEINSPRNYIEDDLFIDVEPKISIEVIANNMDLNVGYYFISLNAKNLKSDNIQSELKSASTVPEYLAFDFITSSNFVGVTHTGAGLWITYKFSYKNTMLFSSWKDAWGGSLYPFGWGENYPYFAVFNTGSYWRRGVQVWQFWSDYNNNIRNFRFADKASEFYGRTCSHIGTYDSWSCYVGTPPAGTQAFMYPNNRGAFYYTPVPGSNPCPLPGSHFDNVNCYFANIPAETKGFIYANKWYVFPDLIPSNLY